MHLAGARAAGHPDLHQPVRLPVGAAGGVAEAGHAGLAQRRLREAHLGVECGPVHEHRDGFPAAALPVGAHPAQVDDLGGAVAAGARLQQAGEPGGDLADRQVGLGLEHDVGPGAPPRVDDREHEAHQLVLGRNP